MLSEDIKELDHIRSEHPKIWNVIVHICPHHFSVCGPCENKFCTEKVMEACWKLALKEMDGENTCIRK